MVRISLILLCALLAVPVRADGAGVVTGVVVNGTVGGGATGGLEVILRAFEGMEERASQATVTDADGAFRFEGLDTGDDWTYLARVTYANVVYSSGLFSLTASEPEQQVSISVYETTTDTGVVRVGRAHIFVTAAEGGLSVTEMYVFDNATDRTYIGVEEIEGRRWAARFELPAASRDLVLDDGSLGGRFLATGGGFVDTEPQWPGSTQVLYSYLVDCPGGACDLSRTLVYPVANLNALVADMGVAVESGLLSFEGRQDAQGQPYLNYAGRALPAGARLDLVVRLGGGTVPTPRGQVTARTSGLPWIILLTVLSVLPLVYPFWRRRVTSGARKDA